MEKGKPFQLFPIARLGSSQVSAVKPQSVMENSSYFQNLKSPLGFAATQKSIHHDSDYFSQKMAHFPEPEKEIYKSSLGIVGTEAYTNTISECFSNKTSYIPTMEEEVTKPASQLYSVLYKEVDRIKKWKIKTEYEVKQKERRLQEFTKTADALQKVIQELQLENEKLKMKLEDETNENRDLINQSNATRHVFDLLKDTCTRASDNASIYENEREETRHMYGDLNNNLERMIMAFEELRIQAENSRQETYIQLKQEAEKRQKLTNDYNLEIGRLENQLSQLTKEKENIENMLLDLRLQLTESTNKNCVLEEEAKNHGSNLEQYQNKSKELTQQLEEANTCLKKNEDVNRCTTIELENAKESLLQTAKEKETLMEELIKIKEQYIFQMNILKNENDTLNKQLKIDQKRLKETEESLENMMLTVHNKSTELEEITKQKDSLQIDLDSLKSELAFSCKSKIELEQQVTKHKTENLILLEKIQDMNTIHETLQNSINDLKTQATNSSMADKKYLEEITELKAELEQKKLKHRDLLSDNERLLTEKSEMSRSTEITARDMKKLEKELEAKRKNEEKSKKEIETLKENNSYLRKEVESFQEKLEINNEEVVEISKKEKQLKTLDNKLITLKKQVEKKNKLLEEIQQENKSMKKKITEESKQCTIRESEVKQLKVELENARLQYETAGSDKQKEIEDYKLREQQLLEQTEKLKIATDGATRLQEESDIRCQHKIAEIVALMEKHKNQYDKMIEDKDVELERHIAMKQDLTSKKTFLETDLSSTKNEIIFLKEQLKRITEEKEIFSRQVEENKANSGREKNNKLLQTTLETPVQSTKKIDPRNSASFSKRLEVPLSVSRVEVGKTLGERRLSPWNSLRCSMYTPRKTYAVKTPPKYGIMQQEQKKSIQEETTKKKRKVAIDFDFHSDTSEPTDILGFCENEEIFKKLDQKSRLHHFDTTATPKKTLTDKAKVLKSAGFVLKSEAMKTIREAGWAAISKVDRRRKMKIA